MENKQYTSTISILRASIPYIAILYTVEYTVPYSYDFKTFLKSSDDLISPFSVFCRSRVERLAYSIIVNL